MNIKNDYNIWFCQFIETEYNTYLCVKCGTEVRSEDGPPPLLCSQPSAQADQEQAVSFSTKVKNFISAASDHLNNGAKLCTDQQIEHRYSICNSCEHFVKSSCNKCGCPIIRNKRFISKLSWASSECPVGKWGKEN